MLLPPLGAASNGREIGGLAKPSASRCPIRREKMIVTAKKITAGSYQVNVDGRLTKLLIEKGDTPKYRERQEWDVLLLQDDGEKSFLCGEQRSLEHAIGMISKILKACQ
jgi:hypothetical protein